ncbi:cupin domain-containing protein [Duganella radicis]|uniref:Anti-sigma factor n=1 Tax=Duganella radicis TaxID=551988 RepID=A0A6L6PIW5_9BURK|nr:cupin domain-containing protein [Duganella radicis]MTV39028.1 anti-sigma factor [Duganella radicis]
MLINADFSRRASMKTGQYRWIASPQAGVERVMLDRIGGEKARATSIVRYAPSSKFPCHQHPGGEEILVLSGTFSEGAVDYPTGWYLRNPPGSSHEPHSAEGAIIFVKLGQMRYQNQPRIRINSNDPTLWDRIGGHQRCTLFDDGAELVRLIRLEAGERLLEPACDGAEILVLAGDVSEDAETYQVGGWIRIPPDNQYHITAGKQGATVYMKTGHLDGLAGGN